MDVPHEDEGGRRPGGTDSRQQIVKGKAQGRKSTHPLRHPATAPPTFPAHSTNLPLHSFVIVAIAPPVVRFLPRFVFWLSCLLCPRLRCVLSFASPAFCFARPVSPPSACLSRRVCVALSAALSWKMRRARKLVGKDNEYFLFRCVQLSWIGCQGCQCLRSENY